MTRILNFKIFYELGSLLINTSISKVGFPDFFWTCGVCNTLTVTVNRAYNNIL